MASVRRLGHLFKRLMLASFVPAAVILLFATSSPARAQERTVWDGVYTQAQADRGAGLYAQWCQTCHRPDLMGDRGPSLVAEGFFSRFEADTLARVFQSISQRMPQDNPRVLSEENYLDLLAFILSSNKFTPGDNPLTADSEVLGGIHIVRRNGPAEAPNFSLVHVVGCLVSNGSAWNVNRASTPQVTKNPDPSNGPELQEARLRDLGAGSYRLVLLTVPETDVSPLGGKRVEAKGILIRGDQGNSLNLTSVQEIASGCE